MSSQIQNIQALRTKLAGRKMSLLVGAGFSKNVSSEFPSWSELLTNLVYELYQDDIDSKIPSDIDEKQRKIIVVEQAGKIVQKVGYLNVVSEYVSRRGYEESIVTYIEQHTPIELARDGDYYLLYKDKRREKLTEEKLKLHKFLLSFPWNNVFTTNYDPLLEASVDIKRHTKLKEENDTLSEAINELTTSIYTAKGKKDELTHKINELNEILNISTFPESPAENPSRNDNTHEKLESLSAKLRELSYQIVEWEAEVITKQEAFAINDAQADNSYTLVTSGADLSLKKNKNIIKLHGSLRSMEDRESHKFGFDRDPRKQYIISAEHYQQYPQKHEAFTQLMRIALLQESFCLIGFSGVDPNFTAWIGWVRDLLYQSEKGSVKKDYKIYLIEVNDRQEQEDGRSLYYENHRIASINLLNKEVIEFLETETQQKLETDNTRGAALQMFFEYLASDDAIAPPVSPAVSADKSQWQDLWRNIAKADSTTKNLKIDENRLVEIYKEATGMASNMSIPDLSPGSAYHQYSFLSFFSDFYLKDLSEDSKSKMLELLILLIQKLYIPVSVVMDIDVLKTLPASFETDAKLKFLLELNEVFFNPQQKIAISPLGKIFQSAFTLDFESLEKELEQWDAPVEEFHIKAGLFSQFNHKTAVSLLEAQLSSNKVGEQQKMFSYELLLAIKVGATWQNQSKLRSHISKYRQAGYHSFVDIITDLIESLDKTKSEVIPYGNGRFSTSGDQPMVHPFEKYAPLQVISLLTIFGFPAQCGIMSVIPRENWYKVFKVGFETLPFPFTYYSLQYNHENTLQRIGQDLAWSEKLNTQKANILAYLFSAFDKRTEPVMILASELFVAIEPEAWQAQFAETLKKLEENGKLYEPQNTICENYVRAGLRVTLDREILYKIISRFLMAFPQHPNKIITYLYYINSNKLFTGQSKLSIPDELAGQINVLIQDFQLNPSGTLFVLGNIFYLLTEMQQDEIYERVKTVDFEKLSNSRSIRIALFFAKNDTAITDRIKQVIVEHQDLWETGIKGTSITGGHQTIALLEFTKRNNPKYGLTFNQDELVLIYEKLKTAAEDIRRVSPGRASFFIDFTGMIHDMRVFLNYFKSNLELQPDYNTVLEEVDGLYANYTEYTELNEGLSSPESVSVIWALAALSEEVEHGDFNDDAVALLINKILLQVGPSLEAGLTYLASWINDEKAALKFKKHAFSLVKLLKKYQLYPLIESDKPFVELMLVKIAYGLESLNIEDQVISSTLDPANIRFNNSGQWLAAKQLRTLG
ncbi:SIR2 family protein [Niabella pedocola]|uniref:SIR2 family protein n=1 Tax=Niabella pedocola TaxID=1752077 RepID=A0ABS8PTJ8_9BACT|nr:SIR2 family protein [Niabella pedocola]MCD2424410.1 SIR2 family protein [Niabella pedocola]